jgi:hypothetical protein
MPSAHPLVNQQTHISRFVKKLKANCKDKPWEVGDDGFRTGLLIFQALSGYRYSTQCPPQLYLCKFNP